MSKNQTEWLRRAEGGDNRALRVKLGYKQDAVSYIRHIDDAWDEFGTEWKGYDVEMTGIILGHQNSLGVEYPFARLLDSKDPSLIIQLVRCRVFHEKCPDACLEVLLPIAEQPELSLKAANVNIDPQQFTILWEARSKLFENAIIGNLADVQPYVEAARQLGSKGQPFSVSALHSLMRNQSRSS